MVFLTSPQVILMQFTLGLTLRNNTLDQPFSIRGDYSHLGDIWQCLQTLLIVVTTRVCVLQESDESRPGCCSMSSNPKDSTPKQIIIQSKISRVPRLRNSNLSSQSTSFLLSSKKGITLFRTSTALSGVKNHPCVIHLPNRRKPSLGQDPCFIHF